ncbi:MAG: hypothetical protein ACRYF0_09635 [Janthinobacterium lividum]
MCRWQERLPATSLTDLYGKAERFGRAWAMGKDGEGLLDLGDLASEALKPLKELLALARRLAAAAPVARQRIAQRPAQELANLPVWPHLFPYLHFQADATCRLLLLTVHKAFHGVFDGQRTVRLGRWGAPAEGRYVFVFDEFDFLENDLLDLLAHDKEVRDPFGLVQTFYERLCRRKLTHPQYLAHRPEWKPIREMMQAIQTRIDVLLTEHGIDFPTITHFDTAEDELRGRAVFQSNRSLVQQPVYLNAAAPRAHSFTLCFYEHSAQERARRVSQSKFYLRVKGPASGKSLTAVEVKPQVDSADDLHTLTVKVEANTFVKIDPAKVGAYVSLGTYYEQFASLGHTYLRQLRPSQVATFAGTVYAKKTFDGKRTTAVWHHNGDKNEPDKYRESRSYQVRHVQERLHEFLSTHGFEVQLAEEPMQRLKRRDTPLPLHLLPVIQVVDNRLKRDVLSADKYVAWLSSRSFKAGKKVFPLAFELVAEASQVSPGRPLLVLTDAGKDAFVQDRQPGLLAAAGYVDPYPVLPPRLPAACPCSLRCPMTGRF